MKHLALGQAQEHFQVFWVFSWDRELQATGQGFMSLVSRRLCVSCLMLNHLIPVMMTKDNCGHHI